MKNDQLPGDHKQLTKQQQWSSNLSANDNMANKLAESLLTPVQGMMGINPVDEPHDDRGLTLSAKD
eukprot:9189753-Ditylum_brightwellii.AAC.2